jgi:two-component system, OmpR family, sensor kinase
LLLLTPPVPAAEQADILSDMGEESDRLIRLVTDLLVLARADAGRNLVREPLKISPILDEACRQMRQLAPQRKISLDVPNLSILADQDAFKQVVLIILDNALKHSASDILVSAIQQDVQVEIRVQDHGQGLPPEKLEHVFERFYRGQKAGSNQGFGLGLPIAKSLVEGQGGTIMMESELGKGSVVNLRFPIKA